MLSLGDWWYSKTAKDAVVGLLHLQDQWLFCAYNLSLTETLSQGLAPGRSPEGKGLSAGFSNARRVFTH